MVLRQTLACAIATTSFIAATGIAAAGSGPPDHFTFDYDGARLNLCGMTVRLDGSLHGIFHEKRRRDGAVLGAFNEHWSIRLTNVQTGRWVRSDTNGIARDMRVMEHADGTISTLTAFSGVERYYAADGTRLFQAAGTTRTEIRVDLADPDDPDDDVVLSEETIKRAGLRSGSADCDALRALMA